LKKDIRTGRVRIVCPANSVTKGVNMDNWTHPGFLKNP